MTINSDTKVVSPALENSLNKLLQSTNPYNGYIKYYFFRPGPSPGFSSRGDQKPEGRAKNQKGGPHFKNTVLDVCSNQGTKREMGGHRFQMGGPGTTDPPLATTLL